MPLRKRLGIVAAAAVGVAIVIAAVVCYLVVQAQLRGQVDSELQSQATLVAQHPIEALGGNLAGLAASAGGNAPYWQIIRSDGSLAVGEGPGGTALPVDGTSRAIAGSGSRTEMRDATLDDVHVRLFTFGMQVPGAQSFAIELGRPLTSVDHVLGHLRLILVLLCVGGVALAAALGRFAARRVLAPLAEVAQTASYIGETDDLSHRLKIHADDEVGQLATRFNAMLDRLQRSRAQLDDSVRAQRQLIADASHELRTPVTSLRTNVEVLLAGGKLAEEDRRRLLADVVEQSEELSALVNDLIELARGDEPAGTLEDLRLDRVVEESLARARRNAPDIRFEGQLEPVLLEGMPERLERAVNNLLDNAATHSQAGGTVEVTVDREGVRVRDHGEGVDEADLPYLFDRFYRGSNSRGRLGSGLGLAIVRQVVEQHGGSAGAANAPGGGAVFTLRLPVKPAHGDGGTPKGDYAPGGRAIRA